MSENSVNNDGNSIKEEVKKNIVEKKKLNIIIPQKNIVLKETYKDKEKPKLVHSEYTVYNQ